MQRQLIVTKDGSHTIAIPEINVTYHSHHGAIQESQHVFIEAGLNFWLNATQKKDISIFEMGLGTGLNALLSLIEAGKNNLSIHYTTVELFPLQPGEINLLNYCEQLQRKDLQSLFEQLHGAEWEKDIPVTPYFTIRKIKTDLANLSIDQSVNLIYYDAFAPAAQPELWTRDIFQKLFSLLEPGGVLVTYCSKGDVRRAMQAAGFTIEKIPGPPGKREMVRAARN
jgi:tRNA U34 5-methylaminomethyl-2-thiouridine-forming methyltransferase MnmC